MLQLQLRPPLLSVSECHCISQSLDCSATGTRSWKWPVKGDDVFIPQTIHGAGIVTYIYPIREYLNDPNVGKYTIHGSSGYEHIIKHQEAMMSSMVKTHHVDFYIISALIPSGPGMPWKIVAEDFIQRYIIYTWAMFIHFSWQLTQLTKNSGS